MIEIKITGETSVEIHAALQSLLGGVAAAATVPAPAAPATAPAAPAKTRKPRASAKAEAPEAEDEAHKAEDEAPKAEATDVEGGLDYEKDVRPVMVRLANSGKEGREKAVALLAEHGVKMGKDLSPAALVAVKAAAEAFLSEDEPEF